MLGFDALRRKSVQYCVVRFNHFFLLARSHWFKSDVVSIYFTQEHDVLVASTGNSGKSSSLIRIDHVCRFLYLHKNISMLFA